MGTVAFRPLTTAEQIFKSVVWDSMIKAGEVWVEGAVPFLALPVIKNLDEFAIQELTDAIFNQFVCFIDVTAIRIVGEKRQSAWASTSEKLLIISKEQGVNSDAFKQALSVESDDFAQFVHTGP